MDASQYYGSVFLKTADVKAATNGRIRATITNVEEGRFGKLDVTFADNSKLSANATNTRRLVQAFGKSTDDWIGQIVEMIVGMIEYQGREQEAVLVVPIAPPTNKRPTPARQADFDDFGDDEIKF